MPTPELLFTEFDSEHSILEAVKTAQTENLYLEFKQKSNPQVHELNEGDKRNFSEGLSQFANSDGGIQIWGIETKKPGDMASRAIPIKFVNQFVHNLLSYMKDAVQPLVDGVRIEPIYYQGSSDGFAKILIPRSEKTPHRAMFSREYLKRNQQGKYRLEHFDLEDMFGRRQRPLLRLHFEDELVPAQGGDVKYWPPQVFKLFIINDGRAIGEKAQIILKIPSEKELKIQTNLQVHSQRIDEHMGEPTIQINVKNELFYSNWNTYLGRIVMERSVEAEELKIRWAIQADRMSIQTGEFIIPRPFILKRTN